MAEPDGGIPTLYEVAAYLKAGKRTIYGLAASGEFPAFKLGGTWRLRRADLERWTASRTSGAAASTTAQATRNKSKG